jgi:hypothetical protein
MMCPSYWCTVALTANHRGGQGTKTRSIGAGRHVQNPADGLGPPMVPMRVDHPLPPPSLDDCHRPAGLVRRVHSRRGDSASGRGWSRRGIVEAATVELLMAALGGTAVGRIGHTAPPLITFKWGPAPRSATPAPVPAPPTRAVHSPRSRLSGSAGPAPAPQPPWWTSAATPPPTTRQEPRQRDRRGRQPDQP